MCDCITPDLYSEKFVTARKPHKCFECKSEIKAGTKYHKHTGKWDGYFGQFKICQSCHELRILLEKAKIEDCVPFGKIYEEIMEYGPKYWKFEEIAFFERFKLNQKKALEKVKQYI